MVLFLFIQKTWMWRKLTIAILLVYAWLMWQRQELGFPMSLSDLNWIYIDRSLGCQDGSRSLCALGFSPFLLSPPLCPGRFSQTGILISLFRTTQVYPTANPPCHWHKPPPNQFIKMFWYKKGVGLYIHGKKSAPSFQNIKNFSQLYTFYFILKMEIHFKTSLSTFMLSLW